MLELDQYAFGGSSRAKFVSQPQRRMLGFHPSWSFVEALKGQVQPREVTQPQHVTTKDKEKISSQGEFVERKNQSRGLLVTNPKLTGAMVGDFPVGKPNTMVVGGRDRREQCINVNTELGEHILAENRKRIPVRFSLNSKSDENGKRSDLRRPCWTGTQGVG